VNKKQFEARLKNAATAEERLALMDAYGGDLFDRERYADANGIYSQALRLARQPNVKATSPGGSASATSTPEATRRPSRSC